MPDTSPSDPEEIPQSISITSVSGGVNLDAQHDVNISGDVVGRDKITTIGYTVEQVSTLLTQISSAFQPKPFDGRCPYLGLDAFSEDDADRFFGRETLVRELVARVTESRFVVIAGPSGSGKSSLVRAGLIHTLKRSALPNSDRWLYVTLTPGRDPIESLALAMSRLAKSPDAGKYLREHSAEPDALHDFIESQLSDHKDQRAVIFVDQFEEVFTQVSQEDERVAFLNLLTHAATMDGGRVTALFGLRSDFVSNCATYPQLNALLNQQFMQIGAMQPDELVSAIARPALQVGLRIDPDLVAQIVNDMQDEPGALPLMQFALKDLFDAQQTKGSVIALTLNDYLARGGLRKALERHADAAFAKLSESEQQLARIIFSGLIEIGRGTQDTRRTAAFDELVPTSMDVAQVETVVQKLADARLITTDEQGNRDTVTIAHERLIEAWPWLRKLINENREAISLQNQIVEDAQEWDEHQRDASYLYSGARLATAREQLAANKIVLSRLAQAFIDAGVEAQEFAIRREKERQQQEIRRLRTRNRIVTAVGLVALFAMLVAVFFGVQSNQNADTASHNAATAQAAGSLAIANASTAQAASTQAVSEARIRATAEISASLQRDAAQQQARIALSRQLSAQSSSLLDTDFSRSLLVAVEALNVSDSADARSNLLVAVQHEPQLTRFLYGHTEGITGIALSRDARILISGSAGGTVLVWDVSKPELPQRIGAPLKGPDGTFSVALSPNGKIAAASGCGQHTIFQCLSGQIVLWDLSNPQAPIETSRLLESSGEVSSVAFQPDGKVMVSSGCGQSDVTGSCSEGRLVFWDISNLRSPVHLGQALHSHFSEITSIAFSHDGKMLASENCNSRRPVNLRSCHGEIRLWDVSDINTPVQVGKPFGGHQYGTSTVAFSADSRFLASAGGDNFVALWDVSNLKSPRLIDKLATGFGGFAPGVAFSADSKWLAASGHGNSVMVWDLSKPISPTQLASPLSAHTASVTRLVFGQDDDTLFTGSLDHTLGMWRVSGARSPLRLKESPVDEDTPASHSLAVSADGQLQASSVCQSMCVDCESGLILHDVSKPDLSVELNIPLRGPEGCAWSAAFSHDGQTLAAVSRDGRFLLWDISTFASPRPLIPSLGDTSSAIDVLAFSPNDRLLAGGNQVKIVFWDVSNRESPRQISPTLWTAGSSLVFSPDGQTLASGGLDDVVTLWDLTNPDAPAQLASPLEGHNDTILTIAFSPDGRTLATGSNGPKVLLWDISNRRVPVQLGRELPEDEIFVDQLVFSSDGRTLSLIGGTARGGSRMSLWDVDADSWETRACVRAGRNLTHEEWQWYLGDSEPYRKTCEQWPLESEATPTPMP